MVRQLATIIALLAIAVVLARYPDGAIAAYKSVADPLADWASDWIVGDR